ncbi:MAG TPA: sugar ABC transporter permease [Chloroflexota bacterium]|nr:sugar ABC transporter permease [Chloroflexota bacterium]
MSARQAAAGAAGVAPRRRLITRIDLIGWAFISPWLIGFVVFTAGPFLASLFLSLTNWDVAGMWSFVGARNYERMLTGEDDVFALAVGNTAYYVALHVPGVQIIALALAALLNQQVRGIALYRTIFYLPAVTAGVATAYLWVNILSKSGLLNSMLAWIGVDGPNWLYSMEWSMPAIIIYSFWNVGTPMLVYLAALQGVPVHLHEAAMIDGAGIWQRFRRITVPMITPALFFNIVLGIIGSFQVFTAAYIITQGGPANATLVYILHLYRAAFQDGKMGYAAALAWFLFLIILAFTLVQLLMAKFWVYYEGEHPQQRGAG